MQLTDAYDPQNIFAKILRDEMPSIRVFEDETTLAFMDIMPQSPGHVLVIPRVAATNVLTLSADDARAVMTTTHLLAPAVQKAMEAPGLMLAQLNGAAAGQTVPHFHMHIIPRHKGLEMLGHGTDVADMNELADIAARIRAAI
ncbi:MAG: HIT domain-containing protein [Pseudomonadota bacterium]|nr:HIT domain-containing protein [Pseudomonadota bacterium]